MGALLLAHSLIDWPAPLRVLWMSLVATYLHLTGAVAATLAPGANPFVMILQDAPLRSATYLSALAVVTVGASLVAVASPPVCLTTTVAAAAPCS